MSDPIRKFSIIRLKRQNALFCKFTRLWLIATFLLTITIILFLNIFPKYHTNQYNSLRVRNVRHEEAFNEDVVFASEPPQLPEQQSLSKHCETIHIGIVCSGYRSNLFLHTLLKSIYFHRINPLHFHIIVSKVSEKILKTLFESWDVPQVYVTFYNYDNFASDVRWVPNSHYSGIFGLLKLMFPKIIPLSVTNKILVLDIDMTVVSDFYDLWNLFKYFNRTQAIGIVENQSDFYLGKNSYSNRWPTIGRGFNSGVLLYDLKKLKDINWSKFWPEIAKRVISVYGSTRLGDQDIINAIIREHSDIYYEVPCYWNTQLSDHTLSYFCYKNNKIKIIHFNSPKKINVVNRDGEYFRNLYTTYLEYNGNLLRKQLQLCNNNSANTSIVESEDVCGEFNRPNYFHWRTLLFFREYKYNPVNHDVTFVAQLSYDRLQTIEDLVKFWPGPISLTLYVSDPELDKCISFIDNSEILQERLNVAYHAVFKDGNYYPINILRNVAVKNVDTPFVFLADIDFLPMKGLYEMLRNHIMAMRNMKRVALIVPAFETQMYNSKIPRTKKQLLKMWETQSVKPFLENVWTPGHAPTDFRKWKSATEPYIVKWQPDFEPYVVVTSDVVLYDERFVGFGWNKVSHIMELEAQDYQFIVLPNCFMVHKPHGPSYDITRFRTSPTYRMCLQLLKEDFIQKLNKKYGKSFGYSNTSVTFETKRRKRNFMVNTTEDTNTDYPILMQ